MEAVTNAMYAVGLGNEYVQYTLSDFDSDFTAFCEPPAMVSFTNYSVNGTSFIWDFGDGQTSTDVAPDHTYTSMGTYTVSLIADGGVCGSDTMEMTDFVSVDPVNPCLYLMPSSGSDQTTNCSGTLFDSGGDSEYLNNNSSTFTIEPMGASVISLNFEYLSYELAWDTLFIYDGPDVNSPLIGSYTGDTLPGGGQIITSGGAITFREQTDQAVTASGFEVNWQCSYPENPPVADFEVDNDSSCTGIFAFTDLSYNGPTSWLWDFGDGNTSTDQNPEHIYSIDGDFTISLIAGNDYGTDTVEFQNIIHVNLPDNPVVQDTTVCGFGEYTISAQANGEEIYWYANETSDVVLGIGETFNTPFISTSTDYYAQSVVMSDPEFTAKPDNSGGGGYFGNVSYIHYLVFDCYTPFELKSVKVYADGAGDRHIALRDANENIIQEVTVFVPSGESRVDLNFTVPVGLNLQLVGLESPDLFRNNAGINYPYEVPGVLSIKYSSADTDPYNYYYYFYDWEIQEEPCVSAREPLNISVVDVNPGFNGMVINTFEPDTIVLDAGAGYDSYLWQDGSTDQSFNVADFGWHYIEVSSGTCSGIDSVLIDNQVSVSSMDMNNVLVYPNPTSGEFFVKLVHTENYKTLKVYNALGELVFMQNKPEDMNRINLKNSGLYILQLSTGKEQYQHKIIVQ
ncbi:MAG: hypothetical protein C0594_10670 [Marinilabiliales bacterium]|nr:MAG: hypothetical protein C0594_10670 [Marinilabiliales bacterium]